MERNSRDRQGRRSSFAHNFDPHPTQSRSDFSMVAVPLILKPRSHHCRGVTNRNHTPSSSVATRRCRWLCPIRGMNPTATIAVSLRDGSGPPCVEPDRCGSRSCKSKKATEELVALQRVGPRSSGALKLDFAGGSPVLTSTCWTRAMVAARPFPPDRIGDQESAEVPPGSCPEITIPGFRFVFDPLSVCS
jgi:hypothetical protein